MTVTLYRRAEDGWTRTILEDVWAVFGQGASHSAGFSRSDAGETRLVIPWRPGLEIGPGDGVYPGRGPVLEAGPLRSGASGIQIVTGAKLFQVGGDMDHWEVTAK